MRPIARNLTPGRPRFRTLLATPLYHWTHLELRRPFGITGKLLSPSTADEIWDQCNDLLAQDAFSARGIMKQMNVKMVGTTDDPIDSLEHHAAVAKDNSFDIKVLPSWRPDKAFNIELATFNDYVWLSWARYPIPIFAASLTCKAPLTKRLDHFAAHGCKVSGSCAGRGAVCRSDRRRAG